MWSILITRAFCFKDRVPSKKYENMTSIVTFGTYVYVEILMKIVKRLVKVPTKPAKIRTDCLQTTKP
jgi:proline dehydrogenase